MSHPVPAGAIEKHIAFVGKTGSGKTYAAKSIVEQLVRDGRQVCVIDPTSAWWGLRLRHDGKSLGFPVTIIGGEKADVPLAPRSGEAVARLVTAQRASVVIDTGGLTVGEYTQWFTDFAGALYREIKTPLHLVIDEAHQFMPQGKVSDPQAGRMLHAGNRLMSGGRSRGVRAILITQRPAKLHKDSLTCADTLVAMRVIAPQDRQAVKDWIDGCGDQEQGRQVLNSLAQLQCGEAWVWFPEGNHLERARFPKIATYDSSAAPTHTGKHAPRPGEIDLTEVRTALAEAVKEAEANDPRKLRVEIGRLQAELVKASKAPLQTGIEPKTVVSVARFVELSLNKHMEAAVSFARDCDRVLRAVRDHMSDLRDGCETNLKQVSPVSRAPVAGSSSMVTTRARQGDDASDMASGERKMLIALLQHGGKSDRDHLSILTGFKRSTRDLYLQRLQRRGLVVTAAGGAVEAADGAVAAIGDWEPLPAGDALRAHWLKQLPSGEAQCLEAVCAAWPNAVSREAIGEATGLKRSTRDLYLQRLQRRKLLSCTRDGVTASDALFDGGQR